MITINIRPTIVPENLFSIVVSSSEALYHIKSCQQPNTKTIATAAFSKCEITVKIINASDLLRIAHHRPPRACPVEDPRFADLRQPERWGQQVARCWEAEMRVNEFVA